MCLSLSVLMLVSSVTASCMHKHRRGVRGLTNDELRRGDHHGRARGSSLHRPKTEQCLCPSPPHQTVQFDILMRDLPRATRLLFQLWDWKKKGEQSSLRQVRFYALGKPLTYGSNAVFLGWTACIIFDFKGCVDATQNLHFFPPSHGPVEVPIKTTLSNTQDPTAASMSIVLSPDQVLSPDSGAPNVRIVHSMPNRNEPIEGDLPGKFVLYAYLPKPETGPAITICKYFKDEGIGMRCTGAVYDVHGKKKRFKKVNYLPDIIKD